MPAPKIALVHDYWVTLRGGERVFLGLTRLFPQADRFVLVAPRSGLPEPLAQVPVRRSFLSDLPGSTRYYRAYLPLYPAAARSLDLRAYDLVISSSSGFTHQVRTRGAHLCYCHTPLRYAWQDFDATLAGYRAPPVRWALRRLLLGIRRADVAAAGRVSAYLANSQTVQARIAAYYGRESTVVHPFAEIDRFTPQREPGNYLLVVSQLHPYKRVDLAVRACTQMGLPLVVVGVGPERAALERLAGPTVRFVGRVAEEDLPGLYANATALLQCGEEDFGIVAIEAQASGRPVIALGRGGALETVIDSATGIYFHEPTTEAVIAAIQRAQATPWQPQALRAHAATFDEAHFRGRILAAVTALTPHLPEG
jgi:glycosyltransferase involved in cell wall biosynthesis